MSADPRHSTGRDAQKQALELAPATQPHAQPFPAVALAVLGVVYGDIGTSPIYALCETFAGKSPVPVSPENLLGVLSLILWTLILVISLKYMIFVLRGDNRGEGGTFALLALLNPDRHQDRLRPPARLDGVEQQSRLLSAARAPTASSASAAELRGVQCANAEGETSTLERADSGSSSKHE